MALRKSPHFCRASTVISSGLSLRKLRPTRHILTCPNVVHTSIKMSTSQVFQYAAAKRNIQCRFCRSYFNELINLASYLFSMLLQKGRPNVSYVALTLQNLPTLRITITRRRRKDIDFALSVLLFVRPSGCLDVRPSVRLSQTC